MTIVRIRKAEEEVKRKSEAPLTVEWNNSRMIRIHSLKAVVDEIINLSDALDVVKVNIIGNPSTGKTVLASTIAHLIHKQARIPFAVKMFGRDDLKNFSDVLKTLQPINHVLIFDDVSFLKAEMSNKQISNIEREFTMIRHLEGGKDIKVIAIFNSHYTVAVSKYLRQSDFHFYTTVGSSDIDHLTKLMGRKYLRRISMFQKTSLEGVTKKQFTYTLSKKRKAKFTYKYRQPFAPVLFFNGFSAREVVFPIRTWVDRYCMTCEGGTDGSQSKASMEKFDEAAQSKFGIGTVKQALRFTAAMHGFYSQRRRVKQAMTFIERFQEEHHVNLADMLKFYGIENLKTRLIMTDEMKDAVAPQPANGKAEPGADIPLPATGPAPTVPARD